MGWSVRRAALALVFPALSYAASPYVAAYSLNQAIRSGDTSRITRSVDWQNVRASLRWSVIQRLSEAAAARPAKPGFLKKIGYRMGDALAPRLLDSMLKSKVSPAGFVRYMREPVAPRRLAARGGVHVEPAALGAAPPANMLSRIARMKFVALDRFEVTVADKSDAERIYRAVFALRGGGWILSEVEVLALGGQR